MNDKQKLSQIQNILEKELKELDKVLEGKGIRLD
jgi:hypothetical protein